MHSEDSLLERGVSLMDSWRADWNKFAREVFRVRLDSEQAAILESVQHNPRVSVVSGTARGKDFVAACAATCFLYLTPRWDSRGELVENTKVALTAPTDRQVKNIMMPEITRLFYRARRRGVALPGKMNAYDIRTDYAEWFLTGFKASDDNHEAWTGFHAVNTMFVVTEASGLSDSTFEAIEGNLQGNSRLLLVFNPNTPTGYAARSQKSDRWERFRLSSLTAPNVVQRETIIHGQVGYPWVVDKLSLWCSPIRADEVTAELDDFQFEGQWYRPSDVFRRKVLGLFPKVSDDVLIPAQWSEIALQRWKDMQRSKNKPTEPPLLGVDVAGMGRDSTVYCIRRGSYVEEFKSVNSGGNAAHMQIAGEILARRKEDKRLIAFIDTIGEGAGVFARCIEQDSPRHIVSCKYSERAARGDKELSDYTGQYRFINMRAYLFWAVRDWLNPKNGMEAALPFDKELFEEMSEIRWSFRSDGRVQIESKDELKKRIGRSSDKFDALANTFYPTSIAEPIDVERLSKIVF